MELKSKVTVNWKNVNGAAKKKRRLHLVTAEDGLFHCPVKNCDHDGFITQRGYRKHVKSRHEWFYYFDERPEISRVAPKLRLTVSSSDSKSVKDIPSLPKDISFAQTFLGWLVSAGGGGRSKSQADQYFLVFLNFCELQMKIFCMTASAMLILIFVWDQQRMLVASLTLYIMNGEQKTVGKSVIFMHWLT